MSKFTDSVQRRSSLPDQRAGEGGAATGRFHTIYQISRLPEQEKRMLYASLVPPEMWTKFQIDPTTLCSAAGESVFHCRSRSRTSCVRIELYHQAGFADPIFLLEMTDTSFGDVEILFVNMNDPTSPRFQIDRDEAGNDTIFATAARNIPEELRAMRAGLAPGQMRKGLRMFRSFLTQAHKFCARFGIQRVKVEPLAYHNAIVHEFYGFRYLNGRATMQWIDREFTPGGCLFERLDGSTPFRQPGCARSIRGRSWAIHDGILGEPWQCPKMYYTIAEHESRLYDPFTCHISSHYYQGVP
jgi:hypothetical protein